MLHALQDDNAIVDMAIEVKDVKTGLVEVNTQLKDLKDEFQSVKSLLVCKSTAYSTVDKILKLKIELLCIMFRRLLIRDFKKVQCSSLIYTSL